MSGPKVVRIVTREEILEICYGELARVDAALAEWTRVGQRNDCIDDAALAEASRRRDALASLIQSDRFMDLQKQAPLEAAFLRSDLQKRLATVAAEQIAARSKERREREAATALLTRLRAEHAELDPEMERGLQEGNSIALSKGLLLLSGKEARPDSELANRLRDGEVSTFEQWASENGLTRDDSAIARIEKRIEEIRQLSDSAGDKTWRDRLEEAAVAGDARRSLILDALEVETGRALTAVRQHAKAKSELEAVLAEARAAGVQTSSFDGKLDLAATSELVARTTALTDAIASERERKAVAARRAAVLESLSGLGYEVSEGMSSAWASEGRLVVRNAARPDYGVELVGAGRFQMRPVAFDSGTGTDPVRDRDAEVIWCGDVGVLSRRLAEMGDELEILKSTPVGEVPLKRIAVSPETGSEAEKAPILRQRDLR